MARNRIIYQSEALFITPGSTGCCLQESNGGDDVTANETWSNISGIGDLTSSYNLRSLTMPISRVQNANFNFTINRTDINEFGKLARLDSISMESPTVGLDFSYYLTDGANERKMGFNIPTNKIASRDSALYNSSDVCYSGISALSGLIEDSQGNNFFILTSEEGVDVHDADKTQSSGVFNVIGIGNGFITDYTVEAAVGAIPTASVTVEAFNINVNDVISGGVVTQADPTNSNHYARFVPSVTSEGSYSTGDASTASSVPQFIMQGEENANDTLAINTTGTDGTPSALRPGDITLSLSNSTDGIIVTEGDGKAHIQSFTLSMPMSRTVLGRLGNTFGYARVVDLPLNGEVTLSTIVSEYNKINLFHKLCDTQTLDMTLSLYACNPATGSAVTGAGAFDIQFQIKGARLESQTISNAIGDNQTADLTFSFQVGGANDTTNGLIMNGSYNLFRCIRSYPLGEKKLSQLVAGVTPAT